MYSFFLKCKDDGYLGGTPGGVNPLAPEETFRAEGFGLGVCGRIPTKFQSELRGIGLSGSCFRAMG